MVREILDRRSSESKSTGKDEKRLSTYNLVMVCF